MHVLVIGGPIASGKSSVARAVASLLADREVATAVIDLDLIYEMLAAERARKHDPQTWSRARRLAGSLANAMFANEVQVVAVEGDLLREAERVELVDELNPASAISFVTLQASFDLARQRVRDDPTRDLSRDPAFLDEHYRELTGLLSVRPPSDLVFDTGSLSVDDIATAIVEQVDLVS
ncbi:MAG TPA: AAA family ATPase [Gaiellaceae bacterium]|nr:AAA family ATPase [Gaiellaceae bacterium]